MLFPNCHVRELAAIKRRWRLIWAKLGADVGTRDVKNAQCTMHTANPPVRSTHDKSKRTSVSMLLLMMLMMLMALMLVE